MINGKYALEPRNAAMTRFLVTPENPTGWRLEDILGEIQKDIIRRCGKILDDPRSIAGPARRPRVAPAEGGNGHPRAHPRRDVAGRPAAVAGEQPGDTQAPDGAFD